MENNQPTVNNLWKQDVVEVKESVDDSAFGYRMPTCPTCQAPVNPNNFSGYCDLICFTAEDEDEPLYDK